MSVDHVLRLTVRFQVGTFHREADVCLPAGATLAEAIPEVVALVGAPRISRPWQASTAGGGVLDTAVPLHRTSLEHGSVLILTPRHVPSPPVVRDAAEALAAAGSEATPQGLALAGALAGCLALLILALTVLPVSLACGATAGVVVTLLLLRRDLRLLAVPAVLLAATAAGAAVLESARPEELQLPATWGWATVTGVCAAAVVLLAVVMLGAVGPQTAAATGVVTAGAAVAATGVLVPAHLASPGVAPAALLVATGIVLVGQIPALSVRVAGLRIPRLPTAGQSLDVADHVPPDTAVRARRARLLHAGAAVGASVLLVPALLFLGYQGGVAVQALCVSVAGAVLLHAVRHRQVLAAWAWMVVGLGACVGSALAAPHPGHPVQWLVAGTVTAAGLTAPLWASRVPDLEPTTLVWWERAESLAVAACLPLSAHLAGLFLLIRGLG